ncbi:MAG TPA: hypothetical protein VF489_04920 [Sphingobium sp.]
MKMLRTLVELAFSYLAALVGGFLLYLLLIRSPLLNGLDILFYRGIAIAALTAVLMGIAGLVALRWVRIALPTLVGAIALSLAFNLCFLITFPVTFDRSITMFLLARIEQNDGKLDAPMLEQVYVREYLGDMRQIDRRVAEQLLSGNVRMEQNRIHITAQGRRLLAGGRTIGRWFGADPRFVTARPSPPPAH